MGSAFGSGFDRHARKATCRFVRMGIGWPDEVDQIIGGDLAAGVVYADPRQGRRDRADGAARPARPRARHRHRDDLARPLEEARPDPLEPVRRDRLPRSRPRRHRPPGVRSRPGKGDLLDHPDRAWLESIGSEWEHFLGPIRRGPAGKWLEVYYWQRVAIEIDVSRVVVWPDLGCRGRARRPRRPAARGGAVAVGAEERHRSAAERRPARQGDRRPPPLPARLDRRRRPADGGGGFRRPGGAGPDGVELVIPDSVRPEGARRAGLTAHEFKPRMIGQEQHIYTGWLDVAGDRAVYAPHTRAGYKLPASKTLFTLAAGGGTRAGIRKAREKGLADADSQPSGLLGCASR